MGVQIATREEAKTGRLRMCPDTSGGRYSQKRPSTGQHRYGAEADWGVVDGDAHWRNLANTTGPSVRRGDAALCLINVKKTL